MSTTAMDNLLATLEDCELSATELRVLLRLTEGEVTAAELAKELGQPQRKVNRVGNRLAMRGLVRRRFERGTRSYFVFGIAPCGLTALQPLRQWLPGG
jgi:sugar-specific transcriptional regulator TrmB